MDENIHALDPKACAVSNREKMARILCENRTLKSVIRSMEFRLKLEAQQSSEVQAQLHQLHQMREANQSLVLATFGAEDSRALAEALSERQKVFLSMLSHELRNPMASIALASDFLARLDIAHPQADKLLAIIRRQTAHLTRLSDDLSDVARISSGKISLKSELVSLQDVLISAQENAVSYFRKRHQRIDVRGGDTPAYIHGDAVRLSQLFANLLVNGSKFSPLGHTIYVSVNVALADIKVSVRDNGVGIAPAAQAAIFELFAQGTDSQNDNQYGGLGIGLSLVRTVAELHGGTVMVRSEGVGYGSEFIVTLPRATSPCTCAVQPGDDHAAAGHRC